MAGRTRARPIRIVFLVDENEHWEAMLAAIFADCYSRWGGRFNLIVPCKKNAPRAAFVPWVEAYDPDIIYSYVDLSEGVVRDLYERCDPAFVVGHNFFNDDREQHDFRPDLPMPGLSSLSTCIRPSFGGSWQGRRQIEVLDKHPAAPDFPFLDKNFGTFREIYQSWPLGADYEEYAKTITLTPQHIVDDPRSAMRASGDVVVGEDKLCEAIAGNRSLIGPSSLSSWFTPRMEVRNRQLSNAFSLIVGDTFSDHLLFWNSRSLYPKHLDHELVSLLLSPDDLDRSELFDQFPELFRLRNHITPSSNSGNYVSLWSTSVDENALKALADRLGTAGVWIWGQPKLVLNIDESVPSDEQLEQASDLSPERWTQTSAWQDFSQTENGFTPPKAVPEHLRDLGLFPYSAREGLWAQDLEIERPLNLSQYDNVQHTWRLPRRLRMAGAFTRMYQPRVNQGPICAPRVNRVGMLTLFTDYDGQLPKLNQPSDETVFRTAVYDAWLPKAFKYGQEMPNVTKARWLEISDKGRYHTALLGKAGSLNKAEEIFLNAFWLAQFAKLGADPSASDQKLKEIETTLRGAVQTNAALNDSEWHRISKAAFRAAQRLKLPKEHLSYDQIGAAFENYLTDQFSGDPDAAETKAVREDDLATLDPSIQYLASKRILHQGHAWKCRKCKTDNWVSIGDLQARVECNTCSSHQPGPVSEPWAFRLDGFVREGLANHGLLPVVWCVSELRERAKTSFFFLPSALLYFEAKSEENRRPDAEVDLIAVADGQTYLCEVKSSARSFGQSESLKFIKLAKRFRPDVAMLAVMCAPDSSLQTRFRAIASELQGAGIEAELMFDPQPDSRHRTYLPSGSTLQMIQYF